MQTKYALVHAELRLQDRMDKVEHMAEMVMKARKKLCSERIAVVERTSKLEERTLQVAEAQHRLQRESGRSESLYAPVLKCLDYQIQWADEVRLQSP